MLAWGRTVYMAMVGCRRIEERERVSDADRRGVGDRFYILLNFRKP